MYIVLARYACILYWPGIRVYCTGQVYVYIVLARYTCILYWPGIRVYCTGQVYVYIEFYILHALKCGVPKARVCSTNCYSAVECR